MHVRSPRVVMVVVAVLALSAAERSFAQTPQLIGFVEPPTHQLTIQPFTDSEVDDLLSTLDRFFAGPIPADDPVADPELQLWKFTRWIQTGKLTPGQEGKLVEHLGAMAAAQPQYAGLFARAQDSITTLTIGKKAPEIVGRDLDGTEFRLSDYRGKVVVVTFSGDWCGICRAQYPYQRMLLDLYKDWPFAMLGVSSDASVETALKAKAAQHLEYRTWWDGQAASRVDGPIAKEYHIYGWPTTYVLDDQGVIRFVDLRQEDLLKAVHQLMDELERKSTLASR